MANQSQIVSDASLKKKEQKFVINGPGQMTDMAAMLKNAQKP